MLICPNGHRSPQQVCQVCNTPIVEAHQEDSPSDRTLWTTAVISVIGALVSVGALAAFVLNRAEHDNSTAPATSGTATIKQWWSAAHVEVDELQNAVDDFVRAVQRMDEPALKSDCRRMHDAAAVGVPAHLPTPDANITAELSAAAEDIHTAAHMCLAVAAGAQTNYSGELLSNLALAERHLGDARHMINARLPKA